MKVWIEGDKAVIGCQYHEKEMVKAVGDYRFHKGSKTWRFPVKRITRIIDMLNIGCNEETKAVYGRYKEEERIFAEKVKFGDLIKTHSFIGSAEEKKFIEDFKVDSIDLSQAYDHQKRAIYLGILFGRYALFMETGTMKTYCSIKLIEYWRVPTFNMSPLQTLEAVRERVMDKLKPCLCGIYCS